MAPSLYSSPMIQSHTLTSLTLETPTQTAALGAHLWPLLQSGDCLLLSGPLGAGKTTFARGVIQAACGHETDVPSPSFSLLQTYDATPALWHFDLYRLEQPDEIWELGWEESFDAVRLIEWPQKATPLMPKDALLLSFGEPDAKTPTQRQLHFQISPVGGPQEQHWQSVLNILTNSRKPL